MSTLLSFVDRLRIARTVWTLDLYVQALPNKSRVAIRRELRANLDASAAEVGAVEAVRRLGNLRRLAADYLDAEYADGARRPSPLKASFWTSLVAIVTIFGGILSFDSFWDGVHAGGARPGKYVWDDFSIFGLEAAVFYGENGRPTGTELNLDGRFLLYLFAAFFLGGRYWRLIPLWWRNRRRASVSSKVTS